ncbi:MAG: DUF5622 domain-containing protein [Desulfurococcaceae archaeon]
MGVTMGCKHGKYVYVRRRDGVYVKLRVLKSRDASDSGKYIVVGSRALKPPYNCEVINEEDLPDTVRAEIYG